jgi:hypothetical protein
MKKKQALLAKMAPFTFLLSCCSIDKMGADQASRREIALI